MLSGVKNLCNHDSASDGFLSVCLSLWVIDAVGSWQIVLPMPNLERTSDKESEGVLRCLQYELCAGPQKQEVINDRSSIIFWKKNEVRGVF